MTKKERYQIWTVMISDNISTMAWHALAIATNLAEYKEDYFEYAKYLETQDWYQENKNWKEQKQMTYDI